MENGITKAWAEPETQFDTDHFLVRATMNVHLKTEKKDKGQAKKQYITQDDLQKEAYNEEIRRNLIGTNIDAANIIKAIRQAAEDTLPEKNPTNYQKLH